MKYFKNYQMFNEAIDIEDVRKYLKIERSKVVIKFLDDIFKKLIKLPGSISSKRDERIYIPFIKNDNINNKSLIQQEIESFFSTIGIEIIDYKKGLAKESRRQMKIGKFLVKLKRLDLLKKFNNDPSREGARIENSYMVFSRHPYDIAGMSTDRGWDSCMNIYTGINSRYIERDVSGGSIVVYLIHGDDMNINNPIARLSLKPYINMEDEKDILYLSEKVYPSSTDPDFKTQVDDILEKIQNIKLSRYRLRHGLYCDTNAIKVPNKKPSNISEVKYVLDNYLNISNYTINDDLSVDVKGDVILKNRNLTDIIVQFRKVIGNFDIQGNNLTSLEGCPEFVKGNFDCYSNQLTSLQGGPKKVEGSFDCSSNQLTSLQGGPEWIGSDYKCTYNQLTSLNGSPKFVGRNFNCYANKLTSLKGSPESIGRNFNAYDNKIKSLIGMSKDIGGDIMCYNNNIRTLEGSIKYVNRIFNVDNNELTSLVGGPIKVKSHYSCKGNQLTSLVGSPIEVGGSFRCSDNELTSLEGSPQKVDGSFYCTNNSIQFEEYEVMDVCDVSEEIVV